jgi:hypothetical protein
VSQTPSKSPKVNFLNTRFLKGIERGLAPEAIVGAARVDGELFYLIKWKNICYLEKISSLTAHSKFPQLVIDFLMQRTYWVEK